MKKTEKNGQHDNTDVSIPSAPVTPFVFCFDHLWIQPSFSLVLFFFNDTATTEIYTLSLHDALPICAVHRRRRVVGWRGDRDAARSACRSEEHTSELQSHHDLVCRLLLEKKKKK